MKAIAIYLVLIASAVSAVQCISLPETTSRYATIEATLEGK